MSSAAHSNEKHDELASLLSNADALPGAFLALKQQLEVQTELVDKKSKVIN